MTLVASQFDKQDKSVEAVTARNKVLNKEIEEQKQKIETLRAALANASESFGETDKRTQSWQIQLNNAEAALNNMERELEQNNETSRTSINKGKPRNLYRYSGKVICGKCGNTYRRKTTSAGIRWSCTTYEKYGKSHCPAKKIPEEVLDRATDGKDFQKISVTDNNAFIIFWTDGTETEYNWEDRSRAESWTEEKKEAARERTLQCRKRKSQ